MENLSYLEHVNNNLSEENTDMEQQENPILGDHNTTKFEMRNGMNYKEVTEKKQQILDGIKQVAEVVDYLGTTIVAIANIVTGAQTLCTSKDCMATAKNQAKKMRIESEIEKSKALNKQKKVEDRLQKRRK